ncbi:hypothetical protein L4D76_09885 [Photobacterium sagamiensis]|uniref:hypothetical protein n=1 Tax=Photobacterium sagamiensis TaxID=2910241 RepID=UPI003D0D7734
MMDMTQKQLAFEKAMVASGKDPEKGTAFDKYVEQYNIATNYGQKSISAKHLQSLAGGEYSKARIAHQVLSSSIPTSYQQRSVPDWFITIIESAQIDTNSLWNAFDSEMHEQIERRVKLAEIEKENAIVQLQESDSVIDELQDEVKTLQQHVTELNLIQAELDALKSRYEVVLEDLSLSVQENSFQQQQPTDFYEMENRMAADRARMKQQENQHLALQKAHQNLREEHNNLLLEKGNLEGENLILRQQSDSSSGDDENFDPTRGMAKIFGNNTE